MAVADTLVTALESATTQFAAYQALYVTNGYLPNFSVDGVSINWPEYEASMLEKIAKLQAMLDTQLNLDAKMEPFEIQSDMGW